MQTSLPLTIDRDAGLPLHLQLAEQFRAAVLDGRLQAGHRLPSTRDLARELGVSRSVTQAAYDQLHAEGWIEGRTGAGTFVTDVVPLQPAVRRRTQHRPDADAKLLTLRPGIPYIAPTPDPGWRRAWREVSTQSPPGGYDDAAGLPALRAALADHVARVRGIACGPENVLVTNGTVHGLRLLLTVTRQPGDRIAIEDPGYLNAVVAARDHRLEIVDVPVDEDGLRVDALTDAAAVYVTPSHQYPLGGRLPVARRNELVRWARRTGSLLIEDDYDSEFRYDVAPLPALAQLDLERVVHLGTLSKTLSPALRLGWLVASEAMVDRLATFRENSGDWPGWPMQAAMLAMLRDGYLDQAVRRGRRLYADRRTHTCAVLSPYGQVVGQDAGLHITLLLPDDADDLRIAAAAREAGVVVAPLSEYRRSVPGPPGLVIGYATPSTSDLHRALTILTEILSRR
ncbi:PLP-dependent aminotransferase family protein [Kribbella speibonae]|uniref:PLP-dependent aminotransferase family protein n=1 Tax=Kribbella speibonae TaxID=1572660 RepID=A0A4R0J4K4_9ACTN|nr:PLP-dependent aminotransferase family protein [Kribbella speibonae]TCC18851.1 PLP-dependent aminotransferase family protein [Kribbella speibonae]TCC40440.1 PLP-dependent aminotransferase family protein [Kribbella speibonae]